MQKMYEYADIGNMYGVLLIEVKTCMWTFIKKRAEYFLKKYAFKLRKGPRSSTTH